MISSDCGRQGGRLSIVISKEIAYRGATNSIGGVDWGEEELEMGEGVDFLLNQAGSGISNGVLRRCGCRKLRKFHRSIGDGDDKGDEGRLCMHGKYRALIQERH